MESAERASVPTGVRVAIVFVALLCGAFVASVYAGGTGVAPAGGGKAKAPGGFDVYKASDNSFQCAAPKGWETTGGAAGGIESGALFKHEGAKIDISTDLAGSLMGDIVKSADQQMEGLAGMAGAEGLGGPKKPPVQKLHEAEGEDFAERFNDYNEVKSENFQSKMGESRFSEYTGVTPGFLGIGGTRVHGYRVTMLGGERRVTIIAECPEGDWKTLEPAFKRVINSLAPGG